MAGSNPAPAIEAHEAWDHKKPRKPADRDLKGPPYGGSCRSGGRRVACLTGFDLGAEDGPCRHEVNGIADSSSTDS
jgi:hypothetical protein